MEISESEKKAWEAIMKKTGGLVNLTTQQAAEILGISQSTLYKWSSVFDGPIKPIRIGGSVRWSAISILKLLTNESSKHSHLIQK